MASLVPILPGTGHRWGIRLRSGATLARSAHRAAAALSDHVDLREARPEDLDGADVVVHLAYDRKARIELNLEGVKRVFTAATVVGVPRQIFVSSYSARPDARSEYGRLKYLLETYFLERGQTIVRPGLVIGNGGLFARNMEQILHTPLIPLLNAGNDLLPVVAVEDLVTAMTTLLQREPGAYNLFNKRLIPMRQFVEAINRAGHHRAVYFNIPLSWAIAGLSCASKLRIRLPIDLDNLRALKAEPTMHPRIGSR